MEVNRRKSQCLVYNRREEMGQIEGIEVVKELKYMGVVITDGKNVFDRQRENIRKEMKCLSSVTHSVIEKNYHTNHRIIVGKTYWKGVARMISRLFLKNL